MTPPSAEDPAFGAEVGSILRWAAGLDIPVPEAPDLPGEEFLDLVDRHALSGRLLRRLRTASPSWATPELRQQLLKIYVETRSLLLLHRESVTEVVNRLGGESDPVIVKGISTFLATGEDHTARCGDIDLVCADGPRIIKVLTDLGYIRTRDPFMHEIGEFTRGRTEVDVHSYFPVYSYNGLRRDEAVPTYRDEIWKQSGHRMSARRIDWADLDRCRIRVGRVSVPDPCMQAIALCAHAFLNFTNLWSISHREKPYVKLGELADLHDLAAHRDWDPVRFARLVEHFEAADAVRWAGWASRVLIGSNPLPDVGPELTDFPRCLWWGFWAQTPVDHDSMVHSDWLDMEALVNALGSSTLDVGSRAAADAPQRQIHLSTGQPLPLWGVEVSEDGQTTKVRLAPRSAAAVERVRVDFGSSATEWSLTTATGLQTVAGNHLECSLRSDRDGRFLEVRYRSVGTGLLVGIADEDASGGHTAAVLLPLTLRRAR